MKRHKATCAVPLRIHRLWASIYDAFFARFFVRPRRRAIELLGPQPGKRLLIPGVGTGLDLPHIPDEVPVVDTDISPEMLVIARPRANAREITLLEMDTQTPVSTPYCST